MEQSNGVHPMASTKRPSLPGNFFKFPVRTRLKAVQQFVSSFGYKQGPQTSFNACKARPLARIMDTARMMIHNPQPIKCVEAVFLALYLTAGIHDVERIPLSFKSQFKDEVHQHIVLLVRHGHKYGAFGISRQRDLMDKELEFDSISSIIANYIKSYEAASHSVLKICVGLPVEHNVNSFNYVCWRFLSLELYSVPWERCCEALEKHAAQAKRHWDRWLLERQKYCTRLESSGKSMLVGSNQSAEDMLKYKCGKNAKGKGAKSFENRLALREIHPFQENHTICSIQRISVSTGPFRKSENDMLGAKKYQKVYNNKNIRELCFPASMHFKKHKSIRTLLETPKLASANKAAGQKMSLKRYSFDLLKPGKKVAQA